jgi:hypothetical protein
MIAIETVSIAARRPAGSLEEALRLGVSVEI